MLFNLITEPCIPILDGQGDVTEYSLRTVLLEAHSVQALALPAPTMTPALLRQLLLPVVLHALGVPRSPEDWQRRFDQGEFSAEERERLAEYLHSHRDRFDLFSTERPFAQVGGLKAAGGGTKSATLLVPSVASGNNVPLFSSLTETDTLELTPARALLWLLHAQCWDTAAIKTGAADDPQAKAGKTTGNPTGPLGQLGVILPVGRTLYETLVLNTPYLYDGLAPDDRPQWATPDPATGKWETRPPRGMLDLMTWQSRRIRLIPSNSPEGTRVTQVIVAGGDRFASPPDPDVEPHTAWTKTPKPKAGQSPQRPRRHFSGRNAWQGLGALLALSLPTDSEGPYTSLLLRRFGELEAEGYLPPTYPLRLELYGLEYGNQSAVVEHAIADSLPLPVAALAAENVDVRDALLEAVGQADRLGRAVDRLLMDLRRAAGGEPLPRDKGSRPSHTFLYAIDPIVRRLLAELRDAGDDFALLEQRMAEWEETVWPQAWSIAEQLVDAAPPTTFGGRETKEGTFRSAMALRGFRNALCGTLPRAAQMRRTQPETEFTTEVTIP